MNADLKTHDIKTIVSDNDEEVWLEVIELERDGWKCIGETRSNILGRGLTVDLSRLKDYELIKMSEQRKHFVMNKPKISSPR